MGEPWWKTALIYQVYPRSFADSNGDGVGDLSGIRSRLAYFTELGVDAIWLSPIFASPMADFGYDISDYKAIDPLFGTMANFDALLSEAHAQGLKIILDLVPNHTSVEHPWFRESRSSRDNPKRDWYIWRDGVDHRPPNNWLSEFGGPAWAFDDRTGQFYYHAFLAEQPDLNWRNRAVREAMHDVMRFWLRKGVDGFRVDVLWHLIKDDLYRDNPSNPDFRSGDPSHRQFLSLYSADRPEVHGVVRELRAVVDEFSDRLLIGEIYLPLERLVSYYGRDLSGAHLPFNFSLLETPWRASDIAAQINRYESLLPAGAWPNWVLGNHDRPRIAGRVGEAQARIAAMLLLTLRGTATLYYGDEIGLPQVDIPAGQRRDPLAKSEPNLGRDGCRTPMQWDSSHYAGFSSAAPWLPLNAEAGARNVDCERSDPNSLFNLYRRLIAFRRSSAALTAGSCRAVEAQGEVLVYLRERGDERIFMALNLAAAPAAVALPAGARGTVELSALGGREGDRVETGTALRGHDALLVRLG